MNRIDNPRYCKYHRVINHPIVLNDLIMKLAQEWIIEPNLDDMMEKAIPPSLLAISTQYLHLDHLGHALKPCRSSQIKLNDGPKSLRGSHIRSIRLVCRLTNQRKGKWAIVNPQSYMKGLKMMKFELKNRMSPIMMCTFFLENFFNESIKTPCYEVCEEHLSKITWQIHTKALHLHELKLRLAQMLLARKSLNYVRHKRNEKNVCWVKKTRKGIWSKS